MITRKWLWAAISLIAIIILQTNCKVAHMDEKASVNASQGRPIPAGMEVATLGGGCFWCIEAVYDELKGVVSAESGYAGGNRDNPSYMEVCTGTTGHAEVVQVIYDPKVVSYKDILTIFFTIHDPTTLNRQGADVGTQYRSVIFYHNDEQKRVAQQVIEEITAERIWNNPIVTELAPFTKFFSAEGYHQEYYKNNPNQPYCRAVVEPKVMKFRAKFRERLK